MLITAKQGNINTTPGVNKKIDVLSIEWYETNKRILHKETSEGMRVVLKFLNKNPEFIDGDILWQDENSAIVIEINPCECIVITPLNIMEACALCYEIGNRHLPLFYERDDLMVPFEKPIHNLLLASGYKPAVETRKLLHAFKTTVLPHLQVTGTDSLPGKILQPVIST